MTGKKDGAGARIKEVRLKGKLKQEEFAEKLSLSRPFLSEIENGKQHPSMMLLKLISYTFDIDLGWLLNGEGEMSSHLDLIDSSYRDPALSHEIHRGYRNIISSLAASSQNLPTEEQDLIFDILVQFRHIANERAYNTDAERKISLEFFKNVFWECSTFIDTAMLRSHDVPAILWSRQKTAVERVTNGLSFAVDHAYNEFRQLYTSDVYEEILKMNKEG